ncbi:MAG: hypothetical protein M9908_04395 [Phyllobacteriaceae bacterium]|nr:hypothetical protein [Phyllobacteriaceae bacterium]
MRKFDLVLVFSAAFFALTAVSASASCSKLRQDYNKKKFNWSAYAVAPQGHCGYGIGYGSENAAKAAAKAACQGVAVLPCRIVDSGNAGRRKK